VRAVAVVVACVLVVASALVWFGQRWLVYIPDTTDPGSATERLVGGSDVELRTSDGLTLRAWRVDSVRPGRMAVLYLPGNGGNRLDRVAVARALADEGFTVLLLEYRGYGGNPGRPSEKALVRDAEAGQAHLAAVGFPANCTIYVGESLGTGVAAHLAERVPPAGLVLRSPFTSLGSLAQDTFGGLPVAWVLRDRFDTLSRMPAIDRPVSVLAGTADSIVPPAQSRAVAEASRDLVRLDLLAGVGHNDDVWFGPYLAQRTAEVADAAEGPEAEGGTRRSG
jgi:hypothetical protein